MIKYYQNQPDRLMEQWEYGQGEFGINFEMTFEKHLERSAYFKHNYGIITDNLWYGQNGFGDKYKPKVIIPTRLNLKKALRHKI